MTNLEVISAPSLSYDNSSTGCKWQEKNPTWCQQNGVAAVDVFITDALALLLLIAFVLPFIQARLEEAGDATVMQVHVHFLFPSTSLQQVSPIPCMYYVSCQNLRASLISPPASLSPSSLSSTPSL
eukprot:EG_transcript_33214